MMSTHNMFMWISEKNYYQILLCNKFSRTLKSLQASNVHSDQIEGIQADLGLYWSSAHKADFN